MLKKTHKNTYLVKKTSVFDGLVLIVVMKIPENVHTQSWHNTPK